MIRVSGILLPHHGEHHVFGVEVARWGEIFVAVEFHALAQGKGVGLAVRADAPLGGQRRGGVLSLSRSVTSRLYSTCEVAIKVGPELESCGLNDSGEATVQYTSASEAASAPPADSRPMPASARPAIGCFKTSRQDPQVGSR